MDGFDNANDDGDFVLFVRNILMGMLFHTPLCISFLGSPWLCLTKL